MIFIDKIKYVLIPPNSLLIILDVERCVLTFYTKRVWNQSQKDLNLHNIIWMKMFSKVPAIVFHLDLLLATL